MIKKNFCIVTLLVLLFTGFKSFSQEQQENSTPFATPLVGFTFGGVLPDGNMKNYFKPFLSVGITGIYKTSENWLWGVDGNFLFGEENVKLDKLKNEIFKDLLTNEGFVIGEGGTDAGVVAFNRGYSIIGKVGKLFPLSKRNLNSGIFITLGAGFLQNQMIFDNTLENAPQLEGNYTKGYDNQMRGFLLNEFIGYMYMGESRYLNFYIGFEFSQAWSKSSRDYLFYLRGKDNNTYFDGMYTLKATWLFPLKSRKASDYYYF